MNAEITLPKTARSSMWTMLLSIALLTLGGCADSDPADTSSTTGGTTGSTAGTSNATGGTTGGTSGTSNTTTGGTTGGTTTMDVCDPNPCTNPEPPECDDDVLLTSDAEGTCTDNDGEPSCSYREQEIDCTDTGDICRRGACVPVGTGNDPLPGELVITEIMYDPEVLDDDQGEWIELYNKTSTPLDLAGCTWRDGGDNSTLIPDGVIVPSETWVVFARTDDAGLNGGIDAIGVFDFGLGNDGDSVILDCDGTIIDQVEYDVDGDFDAATGASLSLDPNRVNVDENDQGDFWCAAVDTYSAPNLGTPGAANPICENVPACEPNPCIEPPEAFCDRSTAVFYEMEGTCRDNGGIAECSYEELRDFCGEGEVCSEGTCVEPAAPPVEEGEVIITEVMYNPSGEGFDDDDAEWIELYNTTSGERDLSGCFIKDNNDNDEGDPLTGVVVPGGGYIILGKSSDSSFYGGVTPAATFGFGLNNGGGGDSVILVCGGDVFDRVDYDDGSAFPEGTGASISLDPGARNNNDNGDGANWCLGAGDYAGGNLGTPGRANAPCPTGGDVCDPNPCTTAPVATCDGDNLVTYSDQGSCSDNGGEAMCDYPEAGRTNCADNGDICFQSFDSSEPARCTREANDGRPPSMGDILITEVMYDPNNVTDSAGEWIELYNMTFGNIDLSGCVLKDSGDGAGSPLTGVVLGTGEYAIIGRTDDPANFGGITPAGTFSFNLNNDMDSVIFECDGVEFDRLDYTNGGAFPSIDGGASLSRDSSLGDDWCAGASEYSDGNRGTPAAGNPPCEGTGGACRFTPEDTITAAGSYMGNSAGASDDFQEGTAECTDGDTGPDEVWAITVGAATTVCVDTFGTEDNLVDTVLYVRTSCTDPVTEVGCSDDAGETFDSQVEFEAQPGVQYFVIVDSYEPGDEGEYLLNVAFNACP